MGLKRLREDHLQAHNCGANSVPRSRTLSSCEKPRSRAAAPNTLLAGLAQPAVLPDDDNLPDSKLPCFSGFPWIWLSFISAMKSARAMGLRSVREILEIIGADRQDLDSRSKGPIRGSPVASLFGQEKTPADGPPGSTPAGIGDRGLG